MRRAVAFLFVVLLLPGVTGCARLWSASSVGEIMETKVDPAANAIWASVSTSVTREGIQEKFPRNDREWNELRKAATALSEGATLLTRENRASGNSDWMKWSQALVDAAAETLKAVDAKSPDQILAVGEQIYNTCVGCHGRYSMMTPPP